MESKQSQILLSKIYELLGKSEVLDPDDPIDYDCLVRIGIKLETLTKKLRTSYIMDRAEHLQLKVITS